MFQGGDMEDYTLYFEEIMEIIKKFYNEPNTYSQDEIVNFIVDTKVQEFNLKKSQIALFETWIQGIVRTYFYFKKK